MRRALTLLALDLAHVVTDEFETHDFRSWRELSQAADGEFLRTPRFRLLVPEMILLTQYNDVPPRRVKFSRRNIFKFRGRVEVNGELATDCEFAAMKADRP